MGIKIDDKSSNLGQYSSVCTFCSHYKAIYQCAAFKSIPDEIWRGQHDHREPYPGDNGIQFEALDDRQD